jgi:Kdo2-lipid IVA lauroyltransferase/acyltransferase
MRLLALIKLPLAHKIARLITKIAIACNSYSYRLTLKNISLCLPNLKVSQQQQLAQESICETAKLALETPYLLFAKLERTLDYIKQVGGEQHLQAALSQGNGVILLIPHIGNWEMVGWYISAKYPFTAMYKPHLYPALNRIIKPARSKGGATLVPTNASGIRALYNALKNNQVIGILPDQNPGSGAHLQVPFFNLSIATSTLTAKLVAKTKATVLIACAIRNTTSTGFHLQLHPANPSINTDIARATASVNANIEKCVAANMTQYQWEYNRFKEHL